MSETLAAIWVARAPDEPAVPPAWMSFSSLVTIEMCPRQWSLSRASYPTLWSGFGYPTNPTIASLMGQIVHRSIERLVREVVSSSVVSFSDASFVDMMRKVDGFPGVIREKIEELDEELAVNPRLEWRHSDLKSELLLRSERLREAIQLLLPDLSIPRARKLRESGQNFSRGDKCLRRGHYAEIELRSFELSWYGKVDYLIVNEEGCALFDFKTGGPKAEHEFQMDVYDLLWNFDRQRNPDSLPVKSKTLIYPSGKADVPPLSASGQAAFAKLLSDRSKAAVQEISSQSPTANISALNCGFCSVRQLCDSYWSQAGQNRLRTEVAAKSGPLQDPRIDIEIRLISSNSPRVWRARVIVGMYLLPGTEILVHFGDLADRWSGLLAKGSCIRLLNGFMVDWPDQDVELTTPAVAIRNSSELFIVPEN